MKYTNIYQEILTVINNIFLLIGTKPFVNYTLIFISNKKAFRYCPKGLGVIS